MGCESVFRKDVCIQAKVKISPDVDMGRTRSICVDKPWVTRRSRHPEDSCTFFLNQLVCVQIPLRFAADAVVEKKGIVCGTPHSNCCTSDDFDPEDRPEYDMPRTSPKRRARPEPDDDEESMDEMDTPRAYVHRRREEFGCPYRQRTMEYIVPIRRSEDIANYRYR